MADNERPDADRAANEVERAEPGPPAPAPGMPPMDPRQLEEFEQFRHFQQFQEFQRFQQTQGHLPPAGHGQLPPGGTVGFPAPQGAPPRPPWWRKVLRSKLFRRLIYLLVVILLLSWAYNHYFGSPEPDNNVKGSSGPGERTAPQRFAETPGAAVYQVYNYIADGSPDACFLFDDNGRAAFARSFGARDCPAAVEMLKGKVDRNPDPTPPLNWLQPGARVEISSCAIRMRANTQRLGLFVLTQPLRNEWVISDHRPEPTPCPRPTTVPSVPPSR